VVKTSWLAHDAMCTSEKALAASEEEKYNSNNDIDLATQVI